MEILETSLNDFDILVVTETHLDNQINDSDIALDLFPNIIHQKTVQIVVVGSSFIPKMISL
jgi:hypothetical protein